MRGVILLFLMLVSYTVSADAIVTNKPVPCVAPGRVTEVLEQAGETAVFNYDNHMTDKQSVVVFFRNEGTGTWTLLEFQQGLACVLGYGVQKQI